MSDIEPHRAWAAGFRPTDPNAMVEPGIAPGALWVRVVADGAVINEHPVTADSNPMDAALDAEMAKRVVGAQVYIYDGDTGVRLFVLTRSGDLP